MKQLEPGTNDIIGSHCVTQGGSRFDLFTRIHLSCCWRVHACGRVPVSRHASLCMFAEVGALPRTHRLHQRIAMPASCRCRLPSCFRISPTHVGALSLQLAASCSGRAGSVAVACTGPHGVEYAVPCSPMPCAEGALCLSN